MQKNRVIYVLVLALAITFAYFYKGLVSSMFFYTIVLLPVVSLGYTFYVYNKFSYLQSVDKKFVTKGDEVRFNVDIVNETNILYPYVEILFYGVDTIFKKHFMAKKIAVLPHTKGRYYFELQCQYKGYYEVGLKQIQMRDFLGFVSFKYQVFEPKYITVYPRVIVLDVFPIHTNKLSSGEGTLNDKEEDQVTLSDIRKYAYGDSIKKIHWKLSAKKGEIIVKNFDGAVTASTAILLDATRNPYEVLINTIIEDKVVEVAIALVHYYLTHNVEIDLLYHQEEIIRQTAKDYSYFESLYQMLFKMRFKSEIDFADTVKLGLAETIEKDTIIFITSNLDEKMYSPIGMQRELGHEVILIYISPEELVPQDATQKEKKQTILLALQEVNVKVYEVSINDDIKKILEC